MDPAIRRILVPTDFSEHSRRALEQALVLAEKMGASIDLLHVWEPPWSVNADAVTMMAGSATTTAETTGLAQAGRDLHAWVEQYGKGSVTVRPHVEQGPPPDTLLRVIEEGKYDLVVMGTHGRTGLARLVLGSVAQKVAARAPCPVLTVRSSGEEVEQPAV